MQHVLTLLDTTKLSIASDDGKTLLAYIEAQRQAATIVEGRRKRPRWPHLR